MEDKRRPRNYYEEHGGRPVEPDPQYRQQSTQYRQPGPQYQQQGPQYRQQGPQYQQQSTQYGYPPAGCVQPQVSARQKSKKKRKKKKGPGHFVLGFLKWFLIIFFIISLIGGIFVAGKVRSIIKNAPELSASMVSPSEAATYIYDQNGNKVQKLTLAQANRDIVAIDQIPIDLQHAFVAIEDSRFYEHEGIDIPGILRAALKGLKSGSFSEGASTITQQLLKNSVFTTWTSETTFMDRLERKIQEQYLALKLEKLLSKDEILEDYLNTINLGAGCYGVQAAAFRYFGKDVSALTLSESAVIAGITQNPTRYNPITNPQANGEKRKIVLSYMLDQGYITQAAYEEALSDDVYSRIEYHEETIDASSSIYTYYQDALIEQVTRDLINEKGYSETQAYEAVYSGGLKIYSAQDDAIQTICDEEFADDANFPEGTQVGIDYALSIQSADGTITHYGTNNLREYVRATSDPNFNLLYSSSEAARASAQAFKDATVKEGDTILGERCTVTPQPQASVVIIEQSTGLVKAVVGGRGKKEASLTLNRATYTTRQPGSTFKIISTYAPAIETGSATLATLYDNNAYNYADGTPVSNWDLNNYTGPTSVREAIVRSINIVAVECLTQLTPRKGFEFAKSFGITTLVESMNNGTDTLSDVVQSLALGGITYGVTNLELTGAYACIANGGQYIAPKFYTQVVDRRGEVLLDNTQPASRTVIKESTAYVLTDAMKGVVSDPEGTAYGKIDLGNMAVAGKTGTTSSYKDIWFTGYTPYYTCGIWCGYDNNSDLPDTGIGHTFNKVLWNNIMNRIHSDLPAKDFQMPAGVISIPVCRDSGQYAVSGCNTYEELFTQGSQPDRYCSVHGSGALVGSSDSESGFSTQDIVIYSTDQATINTDAQPDVSEENTWNDTGEDDFFIPEGDSQTYQATDDGGIVIISNS